MTAIAFVKLVFSSVYFRVELKAGCSGPASGTTTYQRFEDFSLLEEIKLMNFSYYVIVLAVADLNWQDYGILKSTCQHTRENRSAYFNKLAL